MNAAEQAAPQDGPAPSESTTQKYAHASAGLAAGLANFSLHHAQKCKLPLLIAVPHAGRNYSPAILSALNNSGTITRRLEDRFVDILAARIARATGASLLVTHMPRVVIDLNRGLEDLDWGMICAKDTAYPDAKDCRSNNHRPRNHRPSRRAAHGLGLVPRRLAATGDIWRKPLTADDLEARIAKVYRPYHDALHATLADIRRQWGVAVLIDLHSMPPLTYTQKPTHFVIGDRFGASSGQKITAAALGSLREDGQFVAHNRPYAGGYVLDHHGKPSRHIHALQVEICRSLYLDRNAAKVTDGSVNVVDTLNKLVHAVAQAAQEV